MLYIKLKKYVRDHSNKKFNLFIKIIHLIIHLSILNYITINAMNENYILNKDINSIKTYFQICSEGKLINNKSFKKNIKPKVSIVNKYIHEI